MQYKVAGQKVNNAINFFDLSSNGK